MWWNFIGRSHEDIAQVREGPVKGSRFGEVEGYDGAVCLLLNSRLWR